MKYFSLTTHEYFDWQVLYRAISEKRQTHRVKAIILLSISRGSSQAAQLAFIEGFKALKESHDEGRLLDRMHFHCNFVMARSGIKQACDNFFENTEVHRSLLAMLLIENFQDIDSEGGYS